MVLKMHDVVRPMTSHSDAIPSPHTRAAMYKTNLYEAKWEKRYKQQVSATEKALQEKRNANISLREVERVLEKERAAAVKAAQEASTAAAEAADALRDVGEARDEKEGGLEGALRSELNSCMVCRFCSATKEENRIPSIIFLPHNRHQTECK